MTRAGFASLLLGLLVAFVATGVRADEPRESLDRMRQAEQGSPMLSESQSRFRIGLTLYQENRYLDAAREFEEAYRLSQHPEVLYNVYVCYRDAGDWVLAAEALRRYLAATPATIPERTTLEQRLANIEQRLAELESNIRERTERVAEEQHLAERRAEAERLAAEAERRAAEEAEAERLASAPRKPHWAGYATVGAGAAALIAGSITGFLAMQASSDLEERCPGGFCPESARSDYDSARSLASATDGLLIGGGVVAAAGVVLLLVLREEPERAPVSADVRCGPSGCFGSLSARF